MKNFTLLAGLMGALLSFAASANAGVNLSCTEVGGSKHLGLKIEGDKSGDTLSRVETLDDGTEYGETGKFQDFEVDGTKAVYSGDDSTLVLVDVALVLGKTTTGVATVQVIGFSGGPGEAGWPDSTTDYSCSAL